MIKSSSDIAAMRESGRVAARILLELAMLVRSGVSTRQINARAAELVKEAGVEPAFLGYENFPAVVCASVNSTAVHGLPSDVALREGDVVGLDFGVIREGWCSDTAVTVGVGKVSDEAERLISVTKEALARGIAQATIGNFVGDISYAIQNYVEERGFEVVRELVGHGIGRKLHESPQIPNFGYPQKGEELCEGMVIAIEPIIAVSSKHVKLDEDSFGYVTADRSFAAHFEHTVAIVKDGPQILTLP